MADVRKKIDIDVEHSVDELLTVVGVTVVALLCGILGSRVVRAYHMHCQESEGYLGPRPSWPQPVADSMAKADCLTKRSRASWQLQCTQVGCFPRREFPAHSTQYQMVWYGVRQRVL